jgi:hypothetical protein
MTSVEKIPIGDQPLPKPQPQLPTNDDVLTALPSRIRKRAKTILKKHIFNLNQDGRIVYENGEVGSSLRDLLLFHLQPDDDDDNKKPSDHDMFLALISKKKEKKVVFVVGDDDDGVLNKKRKSVVKSKTDTKKVKPNKWDVFIE